VRASHFIILGMGSQFAATGEVVSLCDTVGFLASGLVIAAFCMKDLISLRVTALASNVVFLTYGIALGLAPIWVLHAVLLLVNCGRLWQQISHRRVRQATAQKRSTPTMIGQA